ncbi:FUSC family protein [Streptomyces sp. NPDC020917]|uniref:FUSC family protein n=1 Tax=Streptomyces sp. NPDC020917 TaxID=3365102 RepID=UPI00378FFAA2
MSSPSPRPPHIRRLPLLGALRIGQPSAIWFKPALSVVAAVAPPNLALVALGHLDLAMYAMAGSLSALYAHHRPYAARARVLAAVVLGMLAGLAVALTAASLTRNTAVLIAVGAILAAGQKVLCDATRIGPPGHVVLTFVSSASLFAPQTAGQIPGHLGIAAATGTWAWLVGMAPGLLRPYGPERRATAGALNAAAAHAEGRGASSRAAGAAAVHAAWQSLRSSGARSAPRRGLERLVVRAEVALAAPADTDPARLRAWARALRGTGPVPHPDDLGPAIDELHGIDAEFVGPRRPLSGRLRPLAPIAVRTALGCGLAGYGSLALGVGRPYWALVTAASLYQANLTLSWNRGVQRVLGNLLGVLLFAALVPLAHLGQVALVLCCVALSFAAEALMGRNYWLGSVCVTPMALLVTEFSGIQQPGELMTDRVLDTLIGALLGFVAAVAVTNRRAGDRIEDALATLDGAQQRAAVTMAAEYPAPGTLEAARRGLAAALVDLRDATDTAAGEWRQRAALPQKRVLAAERSGHRTLAATVRRQGLHMAEESTT